MNENKVNTEEIVKEEVQEYEKKKTGRKVIRIISNIIFTLAVLFLIAETAIGFLNMQKLNNNEEPIWYIDSKEEKVDGKEKITYNLGLYVIIKTKSGKETKIVLKPFFLK